MNKKLSFHLKILTLSMFSDMLKLKENKAQEVVTYDLSLPFQKSECDKVSVCV